MMAGMPSRASATCALPAPSPDPTANVPTETFEPTASGSWSPATPSRSSGERGEHDHIVLKNASLVGTLWFPSIGSALDDGGQAWDDALGGRDVDLIVVINTG